MHIKLFLGDIVRMQRGHSCGENRWEVTRVGMDVRLRCLGCGRSLLLPRPEFEKHLQGFIFSRATSAAQRPLPAASPDPPPAE